MAAKLAGSLFVVSGPSGAGKGTLVERVMKLVPDAWLSTSMTSRKPRGAETDGIEYHFVSKEQFEQLIEEDGFAEWALVHDNYYGTPRGPVEAHLAQDAPVFVEIDVQGGFQIKERYPEANLIFIAPPSLEVLEQRLRGRGTDDEETIAKRMANAVGEMEASARYDKVIVNDDLEQATAELLAVVQS